MKYIDLFAGIGGFRYGLEAVDGFGRNSKTRSKNERHKPSTNRSNGSRRGTRSFTCVYSNEWDKYASQIYKKHYGEIDTRDITKVKAKEIPDHDLLCAGFPCQSFSIAGKRKGFADTRGTLFFDIARILSEKRPRLVLLENVKGLLSHDKGKTFATILGVLSDLGYECEWQVLNSKHFGVPQNRERVFIVGHLGGFGGRKVFPIGKSKEKNVSSKQEINQLNQPVHSNDRIYGKDGVSPALNTAQGGRRQPKVFMLGEHRTELGKKTRREIRKKEGRDSTLRSKDHKEYRPSTIEEANCLTTGKANIEKWLIKDMKIRRLTPTECERLQGFPDGWTEKGVDENGEETVISDTQRYKVLGNAVSTPVITAIANKLLL